MKLLFWIPLINMISTVVIYLLVTCFREGLYRFHKAQRPNAASYIVDVPNTIEIQDFNQCAGFSSAYLMRHFDRNITGAEAYQKMPRLKNGTILPKHLRSFLRKEGFAANYYRGSLETLKAEVEKGHPVIVFIRSYKGSKTLHYVNVVGYDENNIYIAETIEDYINCPSKLYNRKLSTEDFLALWNTAMFIMPLHKNTFFSLK